MDRRHRSRRYSGHGPDTGRGGGSPRPAAPGTGGPTTAVGAAQGEREHMRTTWRRRTAMVALAVAGLVAAGCSNATSSPPTSSSSSSSSAPGVTATQIRWAASPT